MSKIMLRLQFFAILSQINTAVITVAFFFVFFLHNYKWSQTKRIDRQCSVKLLNILSSAAGLLNAEHVYDSY